MFRDHLSAEETPYIIAEVGSNWLTKEDCIIALTKAAKFGANAVKFQYFTYEDLYGYRPFNKFYEHNPELPREWLPDLAAHCQYLGVDFLCSVFNPSKVSHVDPYVRFHKIASAECEHLDLLCAVAACKKPVILSTGAHPIPTLLAPLHALREVDVCLLACVSAYPAKNVNLFKIDALKHAFPRCDVGFSDHTTDPYYYPKAAVIKHGAIVLEKHFTMMPMVDTPDRAHSLKPLPRPPGAPEHFECHEFHEMTTYVRSKGLIPVYEDRRPDEWDMHRYYNRRMTERGFYRTVKP